MNQSKIDTAEAGVSGRPVADNPKRLYQCIIESGRQLEVASAKCREVQDLFAPELLSKRLRYKELCEKLICESLKIHGPIVREKLWRYAYYEPYNRARQLKRDKPWTPYQLAFIQNHLLTGIGQFSILLWKIQEAVEFLEAPVEFRSDGLDMIVCGPAKYRSIEINNEKETQPPQKWLIELIHICLINMGDLYRYLTDIYSKVDPDGEEKTNYFNGAVESYTKAFLVHPDAGLSHNQLGNLFSNLNGGIHAVYYLLYSTSSANSYEGAFPNLRQLLDRKIMRYVTQPASVEPTPLDMFNFSFFSVVFHFLCEDSHLKNFEKSCQDALTNFNERLVSCDPDLDEKFLFHVSLISIMTVWRLQALNSPNISPAVAFALTIFLQLTTHLGVILEQHSHLKKESSRVPSPVKPLEDDMKELNITNIDQNMESNKEKLPEAVSIVKKKKRKKIAFMGRRRRRRPKSSNGKLFSMVPSDTEEEDSEDEEADEGVDESDCSDDEYSENESEYWSESESTSSANSTENEQLNENDRAFDSGSSNGQSDISGGFRKTAEADSLKLAQDYPSEVEISTTPGIEDGQQKGKFVMDVEDLLKCWAQIEPLLVAISPFIRWLETSPMVKDAFAANCERIFLEKLCSTLNLLSSHDWSQLLADVTMKDVLKKDWTNLEKRDGSKNFSLELPEDRSLIGMPNFKESVSNLVQNAEMSKSDMFLTRIGKFLSFGYWMTETNCFSVIYDSEEKFVVPPPHILQRHLREAKLRKLNNGDTPPEMIEKLTKAYRNKETTKTNGGRRGRGRDEGRDNDRRRRRNNTRKHFGDASVSEKAITVVVVDLPALIHHLVSIKRLACHPKFIIAVPQSVRKLLDTMKESDGEYSSEARASGRWLETAIYKSHPGLMALKEGDKIPLNFPYPEDGDEETLEYFELFEHCNYLLKTEVRQGKRTEYFGDVRDKYSVFFLSGDDDFLKKPDRNFCPIQIARAVGYWVDLIALYPANGKRGRSKKNFKSNG